MPERISTGLIIIALVILCYEDDPLEFSLAFPTLGSIWIFVVQCVRG